MHCTFHLNTTWKSRKTECILGIINQEHSLPNALKQFPHRVIWKSQTSPSSKKSAKIFSPHSENSYETGGKLRHSRSTWKSTSTSSENGFDFLPNRFHRSSGCIIGARSQALAWLFERELGARFEQLVRRESVEENSRKIEFQSWKNVVERGTGTKTNRHSENSKSKVAMLRNAHQNDSSACR